MRTINFAKRNFKELVRDPLGMIFSILLPLFLLFIFQQFKIPSESFKLNNFTPGIIIFGFSFITLFTSTLVSKDRETSLLVRLGVSPMKGIDYILGYIIPILILVIIQNILFFILAIILGLEFSIYIIYSILVSLLISILFIALGILIGSIFSNKSSSGISSIVVQLVCFTSGMYFSTEMVGACFKFICNVLPFESALNILKNVLNNSVNLISLKDILVFSIYTIIIFILSIIVFKNKKLN